MKIQSPKTLKLLMKNRYAVASDVTVPTTLVIVNQRP